MHLWSVYFKIPPQTNKQTPPVGGGIDPHRLSQNGLIYLMKGQDCWWASVISDMNATYINHHEAEACSSCSKLWRRSGSPERAAGRCDGCVNIHTLPSSVAHKGSWTSTSSCLYPSTQQSLHRRVVTSFNNGDQLFYGRLNRCSAS